MNEINELNKIIEDYPVDEDNPFLFEIPLEEKSYTKEEMIQNEDE